MLNFDGECAKAGDWSLDLNEKRFSAVFSAGKCDQTYFQ